MWFEDEETPSDESKEATESSSEDEKSEEDLAADWGDAGDGENDPMNQGDIDDLFGSTDTKTEETGMGVILNTSLIHYERLPMLDVVFDRLVRLLSTTLRNFTSENVEVTYSGIESMRFADYLDNLPLPAMLGVVKAIEWDNHALVTCDSSLIYSMVDVLFGGRRTDYDVRVDGRPYTTIERSLGENIITLLLSDLEVAFEPICPVKLNFERLETNPRFAAIAREKNACIVISILIEMEQRRGKIEILLPFATIEPIRELLLQSFMGEKFGRDSIWEDHLAEQLMETSVDLRITYPEEDSTLNTVLNWKIGNHLELQSTPETSVEVKCGEEILLIGKVGQKNGRLAIKVEDILIQNPPKETEEQIGELENGN